jgi:hypothetical protein
MKAVLFILVASIGTYAQRVSPVVGKIDKQGWYLFYLHGAVVSVLGDNAINQGAPEWGPYQYSKILDSLRKRGFNVISEIRRPDIDDSVYSKKITAQIDTLIKGRVTKKRIIVVGASSGWNIALQVSERRKETNARYVLMGGCWPDTYKDYTGMQLYGRFLSIIEDSDPHKSCLKIFENRKTIKEVKEITLRTGLSHGFFYKGHSFWIDPIVNWLEKK